MYNLKNDDDLMSDMNSIGTREMRIRTERKIKKMW